LPSDFVADAKNVPRAFESVTPKQGIAKLRGFEAALAATATVISQSLRLGSAKVAAIAA
jgi:hypothetical protein